jgi:hypothetical protein
MGRPAERLTAENTWEPPSSLEQLPPLPPLVK